MIGRCWRRWIMSNALITVEAAAWLAAKRLAVKFFAITPEEVADREMVRSACVLFRLPLPNEATIQATMSDATGTP